MRPHSPLQGFLLSQLQVACGSSAAMITRVHVHVVSTHFVHFFLTGLGGLHYKCVLLAIVGVILIGHAFSTCENSPSDGFSRRKAAHEPGTVTNQGQDVHVTVGAAGGRGSCLAIAHIRSELHPLKGALAKGHRSGQSHSEKRWASRCITSSYQSGSCCLSP